jgi:hypothetical protein
MKDYRLRIDSCPHCHRAISWARKSVTVCRCGYDWRRVSPTVINGAGELTAARRMLSIWREKAAGDFPLEEGTGHPLTREISAVYPEALCALASATWRDTGYCRLTAVRRLMDATKRNSAGKHWPTFSIASVTSLRRPATAANTVSSLSAGRLIIWGCTD